MQFLVLIVVMTAAGMPTNQQFSTQAPFSESHDLVPLSPGVPMPGECPEGFEKFNGRCFMFGDHASYLSATVECQKVEAELVQIDDRNYDFLSAKIAASRFNHYWIGGGQMKGKTYEKSGTKCPIIRVSGNSMGSEISTLDCSFAAPFVCMYYPIEMMLEELLNNQLVKTKEEVSFEQQTSEDLILE